MVLLCNFPTLTRVDVFNVARSLVAVDDGRYGVYGGPEIKCKNSTHINYVLVLEIIASHAQGDV